MSRHRLAMLLLTSSVVALGSCSEPTAPPVESIPSYLVPVLYWGDSGGLDYVPNTGIHVGFVDRPVWASDSLILVYSGAVLGGQIRRGVFAVSLDPRTFKFRSVQPYDAGYLTSLDYDRVSDQVLLTTTDGHATHLIRARLEGMGLADIDTLVGPAENVIPGKFFGSSDAAVYYARPGGGQPDGFYFTDGAVDSLLLPALVDGIDAVGFAVAPGCSRLVYGTSQINTSGLEFQVNVYDTASMVDSMVFSSRGAFQGASICCDDDGDIAVMWGDGTESYLTFINSMLVPYETKNTRTMASRRWRIENARPSCSPNGQAIAFSSQQYSSEGAINPWALWVYIRRH